MTERIPEKDWRYFHSLQDTLIERYCGKTLSHVNYIITSGKFGNNLGSIRRFTNTSKKEKELWFVL